MTQLAFGQTAQDAAPNQDETSMKIRIEFNGASMTATLYDNPSARDFASMLPLDLTIDDYSNNEKIAYLPRKLTEEGSGPFGNEAPGDLAYYAPWGNLAFFYGSYRYSSGLIRLGRIDGDIAPLLVRGNSTFTSNFSRSSAPHLWRSEMLGTVQANEVNRSR